MSGALIHRVGRSPVSSLPTVTWNPADKSSHITLSSGNLIATRDNSAGAYYGVRATRGILAADNGYFEVYCTSNIGPFTQLGVASASASLTASVGAPIDGWSYYADTGEKITNSTVSAYGAPYSAGSVVIGVAFKNGKLWFAKDNVWQNSGDPAAGTGEAFSGITGTLYPMLTPQAANPYVEVYGGRFKTADFTYTPPSGFSAWGG